MLKRDLVDAEQRIRVESEGDEELAGGEFRIVEGCSPRVRGFPVAPATPDSIRSIDAWSVSCSQCGQDRAAQIA